MPTTKRLTVDVEPSTRTAHFNLVFASPPEDGSIDCSSATLDTGDGHVIDLGERCAPTLWAWRENRELIVAVHTYDTDGPFRATLHWGEERLIADVVMAELAMSAAVGAPGGST